MKRKLLYSLIAILSLIGAILPVSTAHASAWAPAYSPQVHLDPTTIQQFVSPLPLLSVSGGSIETIVAGPGTIEIDMKEFRSNMLPVGFTPATGTYNGTWTWGYVTPGANTALTRDTYTGPVVVATRGQPSTFKFVNNLGTAASTNVLAYKYSTDQSLHWANPGNVDKYVNVGTAGSPVWYGNADHYSGAIPAAVHLHGAEDPAAVDGGPDSWFTGTGQHGPAFYSEDGNTSGNYSIYTYPNVQEASPLWFHDHTLGATRLNVYMGLAGGYDLIDPALTLPAGLKPLGLDRNGDGQTTGDEFVVPFVVQDRSFDTNGQLFFTGSGTTDPVNPSLNPEHPYWSPEFFGDTVTVNGKVWPFMAVSDQRYRFYGIGGSNSRTWELSFRSSPTDTTPVPKIWQIATDGGYLDRPVQVDPLVLMPGERAEFIVDFTGFSGNYVMYNWGPDEPFDGVVGSQIPANPATTGKVMRFVVNALHPTDNSFNPSAPGATIRSGGQQIVRLVDPATGALGAGVTPNLTRALTLVEVSYDVPTTVGGEIYPGGPLEVLVNNTKWSGARPDAADPNMMGLTPVNGGKADGLGNYLTETPREGTTEIWEIINTTMDAHPIHTHLAQFQLLSRQSVDMGDFALPGLSYINAYQASFPGGNFIPAYGPPLAYGPSVISGNKYGGNPDVMPFLNGPVMPPNPNEAGWKDTVMTPPGMVTRFVVRWGPTDAAVGAPNLKYAFIPNGPTAGNPNAIYDYVWHCHIVDHEDNEMMRPDSVYAPAEITAGAAAAIPVNSVFTRTGTFRASGGAPWTATVNYGDGSGTNPLTLNGMAFNLSHTYASAGSFTITITVNDGWAGSGTGTIGVTVDPALTISTASVPDGVANKAYSQTLAAAGGSGSGYTWALAPGSALPAGLALSAGGVISGTPTTAATTSFTVKVTDSHGTAVTRAYSIVVHPVPVISTASLPAVYEGFAYSQVLQATGGIGPYTWSITAGALPTGLSLNANGAISGTPTAAGTANFTVQVTDSDSNTAARALSIIVNNTPVSLTVTTLSLADGTTGSAYNQTLTAAGGTPAYTWATTSGALPAGLNLNTGTGAITGTPTAAGTANFTVQVTDSAGSPATDTQELSILINANKASPTLALVSSVNPSVSSQSVTFTAALSGATSPTGTVNFIDGGTVIGSNVALTGSAAAYTTSVLTVGAHTLRAEFNGDANNNTAVSSPLSQTVNKANAGAAVASNANPSTYGQAVTFTATVTAAAPGTGTPTGTVQFKIDGSNFGTPVALASGSAQSTAIATLSAATHTVTAVYSGDGNFNTGTSNNLSQTVNKAALTCAPDDKTKTYSQTFTAFTGPVTGVQNGDVITATFASPGTASTVVPGTYDIGATLADPGFKLINYTVNNNVGHLTVNKASTNAVVTTSANGVYIGQAVTFTATVTVAAPGSGTPTGTVNFKEGTTILGTGTLNSSGKATCVNSSLSAGNHNITAEYAGDGNFNGGTSAAIMETIFVPVEIMTGGGGGGGAPAPSATPTPTPAPTATATPSPTPTPEATQASIPNLQTPDGNVRIVVSPDVTGTVTDPATGQTTPVTQITATRLVIPPTPPADASAVGFTYELGPSGAKFSQPITITLDFEPNKVPEGETPYIAWYNSSTGTWEKLTTVSIVGQTITATIDHFTAFSVLAAKPAAPAASAAVTTTPTQPAVTAPAASTSAAPTAAATSAAPTTSATEATPASNWVLIAAIGGVLVIALILAFTLTRRKKK